MRNNYTFFLMCASSFRGGGRETNDQAVLNQICRTFPAVLSLQLNVNLKKLKCFEMFHFLLRQQQYFDIDFNRRTVSIHVMASSSFVKLKAYADH